MSNVFGNKGNFKPLELPLEASSDQEEAMYQAILSMAKEKRNPKRTAKRTEFGRPLIDIVKPQPKAFFAYLNMPAKKKMVGTKRISRQTGKKA